MLRGSDRHARSAWMPGLSVNILYLKNLVQITAYLQNMSIKSVRRHSALVSIHGTALFFNNIYIYMYITRATANADTVLLPTQMSYANVVCILYVLRAF